MTIIIITGKGNAEPKVRTIGKLIFSDLTNIVRALQVKYSTVAPKTPTPVPVPPISTESK
jgi:hypothetical protein